MYCSILEDYSTLFLGDSALSIFKEKLDNELNNLYNFCINKDLYEAYGVGKIPPYESLFKELLDLASDNHINTHKAIMLCVKIYFETNFICHNNKLSRHHSNNEGGAINLIDKWKNSENLESYKSAFGVKLEEMALILNHLLRNHNSEFRGMCSDSDKLKVYLHSIYLNDCYAYGLYDEDAICFESYWQKNFSILNNESVSDRDKWWKFSSSYYGLNNDIGNAYTTLDSIKLRNKITYSEWLKHFSQYEIETQNLLYEKKMYEIQITIKNLNSEMTKEECSSKATMELLEEENKLKELQKNAGWADAYDLSIYSHSPINYKRVLQEYRQKMDYYYRLAVKLLHPDRRDLLLKGKALSEEQEKELDDLYKEIVTIREQSSSHSFDIISGNFMSINKFIRIISRAESIFYTIGIVLPKLKYLIQGDSYEAQIEYLMTEEMLLLSDLANIEAETQIQYSDQEYYQKESILQSPKSIERVKLKYQSIIDDYKKEISALREELEYLFKE
ncbi:MAG: hypothetical protein HUU54_05540 [Ignavibacteriaceae bacterium]|nr:hypothetical protein [Ignavibacteriaceae bacterium]